METVTFRIDSAKGTIRIDRPLFLGATYAVAVDGYAVDTPQIVFADCDGRPVAEVADGTLSLDTEELLAVFTAAGISGAPGVVTVHAWALNEAGSNIAAADIPVFYAPYFSAPSGTLTRIDAKGPKGDQGPKGDKGDKGDDGVCVPVSGWLAFEVDENSHLIIHAATEGDVYATTNGVIDHAKPRFTLGAVGDEIHLLYHFYGNSTNFHYVVDLGNVQGAKGEQGEQGDPGEDGSTDASATLAGTSLDTSTVGSLRAAVQAIGRALGATMTAIALCLCAPAMAQDVSLEELAGLVITNGVGVVTNVNLSGLQPRLPYPTNAIPAAAVTDAPWLSGEADPSVGMTNGTIYVKGASITPLTEHQSLAPVVDYVDAKTTEVGEVAAARVVNATNVLMRQVKGLIPGGGGGGGLTTNDVREIVADSVPRVSPLMWPGDWFIRIEGLEPQPGPSSYFMPTNDVLALMAGGTGVWRSYRLSAEADPIAVRYGDSAPPVDFDVYDPSGAVALFTNNVLTSSGVPGVAHVTGTDTNGVAREAAVVMTPVQPGSPVSLHAAETNVTERFLWADALFSRLANVSTDTADMVEYNLCRSFANRYEVWKHSARLLPRQLSRFGSDGRIRTNEWEALASVASPRAWALKQNRDFFWPELQTNLWCFSGSCHEGQGASAATKAGNWRNLPCIAVAPHYFITAAHYEEWPLSAWYAAPRFPKSAADNDWCVARPAFPAVGKARTGAGTDSDVRLFRVSSGGPIPDQCIARFAPERVLRRLSPTLFARVPCLTVNGHQAVTPYAATGGGSTYYGWTGDVGDSEWRTPYKPGFTVPAQASACVHTSHMYESGSPFFLAAPNGRVVPLGMGWYLNDGGGLSGNWLCDEGLLESLSAMVRADSGGTEDIKLWTFEDLYAGGVTNLTEVAQ